MHHKFRLFIETFVILGLSASPVAAIAASDIEQVARAVEGNCPMMAKDLLDPLPLKPVEKAATLKATCSCFAGRIGSDKKLATYLGSTSRNVSTEQNDQQLQSYIALLAQAALYRCLLPEVESSMQTIELGAK